MSKYENSTYRNYVLCLLTLVYAVSFVDRQLLSILQESIKLDLGLSDKELGLLSIAFAVFYVLAGIPIARWADRSNRRNVISFSIAAWSIMTALSGMAQNFTQLFFARTGVGVGEAGCSPPAHSMISDMFPIEQRASALSFYSIGINVGIMFGFLLGGFLNEYFGWRVAFYAVGLPGLLLALWLRFAIDEPPRGWSENKAVEATSEPFGKVLSLIVKKKYLMHAGLGAGMSALAGYGLANWSAPFFQRSHEMQTGELGIWLAIGGGVFGSIGTFGWGYICDRYGRSNRHLYLLIPAFAMLLTIPFMIYSTTTVSTKMALISALFPPMFTTCYLGATLAVFHSSVEPRMRATSSALFFLIINVIGLGFGPFLIGALSDYLTPSLGDDGLRYAMLIVIPAACVWASLHFTLAARDFHKNHQPSLVSD